MKAIYRILLLLLLSVLPEYLLAATEGVMPGHIVVVYSNKTLVTANADRVQMLQRQGIRVDLLNLDAVNALEARWSSGLPATQTAARQAFEQRLDAIGKAAFTEELLEAYRAITAAIRYKINRYPAIVFDDHYVVYGITDLWDAVRIYSAFVSPSEGHHE